MAVAVRAATTAQNSGASSLSINKPTGTAQGDLLVCACWQDSDSSGSTGSLTGATGFSQAGSTITSVNTSPWGKVFYKVAGASEGASYSFGTSTLSAACFVMVALTSADTTTPIGVAPQASNGTTSTVTAPSISSGSGQDVDDLLICSFCAQGGSASFTQPSGMTEQGDVTNGSWLSASLDTLLLTGTGATGSKSSTCSITPANNWRTLSMVIAAAGSVITVIPPFISQYGSYH